MNPQNQTKPKRTPGKTRFPRSALFIGGGVVIVGVIVVLLVLAPGFSGQDASPSEMFEVKAGDLVINVLESGSLEAKNSLEVKSEVEGSPVIKSIIPEGTFITEEDVKEGRILVELDSASLKEKKETQLITVTNAHASYINAKESYEIQLKQNESDVQAGELNVKFAGMDLGKYLGADLTDIILAEADETENAQTEAAAASAVEGAGNNPGNPNGGEDSDGAVGDGERTSDAATAVVAKRKEIDFAGLVSHSKLGGGALQQRRELESNIDLSIEEMKRASNKLDWTRKLQEKGYVTRDEMEADELALKRNEVEKERAETALKLFAKYEFPKEAEKLLSDYKEAGRELERIKARARSKIAQTEAELKSKEATYNLQKNLLEKTTYQIEKCTIRAKRPGLVVYAGANDPHRRQQSPIQEGASIREGQSIISLPDLTQMQIEVKVNESSIEKVKKGQAVDIEIEAFPGRRMKGVVTYVGPVADSQSAWLGSDVKVYSTKVEIFGQYSYLKPGMTASVAIIVEELKNVIKVPVQAIYARKGETVCYVTRDGYYEARPVLLGSAGESFAHVAEGLKEGDKLLLREPQPNERVVDVEPSFIRPQEEEPAQEREKPAASADSEKPGEGRQEASTDRQKRGEGNPGGENNGSNRKQGMMAFMQKLTEEERQQFRQIIEEKGQSVLAPHIPKMEGLTADEQAEYIRKHILRNE
ncbi:MAG: efflux RND transporter periplasmic adaptor subunit [Planctomycetota bacterium]